jgi:hypothetical protein
MNRFISLTSHIGCIRRGHTRIFLFATAFRLVLVGTQTFIQCLPYTFSPGQSERSVKLTIHFHLCLRSEYVRSCNSASTAAALRVWYHDYHVPTAVTCVPLFVALHLQADKITNLRKRSAFRETDCRTGSQEIAGFYGTGNFITVFTRFSCSCYPLSDALGSQTSYSR